MSADTDPTPALLPPARLAEIRAQINLSHPINDTGPNADARALLAHIDALQAPAVEDGGEALPDAEPKHTPTNDRFDGEVWRGRLLVDDESIYVAVALVDGRTVPMFYAYGTWRDPAPGFGYKVLSAWARASDAHGYARGVAAGEAERVRLADDHERVCRLVRTTERARDEAEDLAEDRAGQIARLTAERDALAKQLDLGPAEVVTLAAWGEERAKSARLTAELAEARAAAATERLLCQAATEHVRDREELITRLREQVADRDATFARLQSALAESQEGAKRWTSLAERNGDDARAHGAERERLNAELDTWREVTGADTPHQLSAELAIARAKRRGATERRRG